jgi:hypothetical protein
VLLVGRLDVRERIAGIEGTVSQIIESGAVKFIRTGLGDTTAPPLRPDSAETEFGETRNSWMTSLEN